MRGRSIMEWLVFLAAMVVALFVRPQALVGLAVLGIVLVPLERAFALRSQKVLRRGLVTDLTHLLVNNLFVIVGTVVLVVAGAFPLLWVRSFDLEAGLPAAVSIALAVVLVFLGSYWGHRLTHRVPLLWRFHAVHHSIEQMDWIAAGRLHPIDAAFTQAFTVLPLVVLGYDRGVFGGVAAFFVLLAIFQHANVRFSVPVLRWVVNTPEWHHWHHALDAEAARQELRAPGRRPDLRDGAPAARPTPRRVRDDRSGAGDRIPPAPGLPLSEVSRRRRLRGRRRRHGRSTRCGRCASRPRW